MKPLMMATALLAAALVAGSAAAQNRQQVTGTGQFCIKGESGPIKCEYQTMAQCQQARPLGSTDQCVERAQAQGTVGGRELPSAPGEQKD
ncbi:MAG: hypothetical protein K2Y71_12110 [Xanthobacteraceae bacterium]|nr:hypothetical protein [Xanthobacteraceae bacterium]